MSEKKHLDTKVLIVGSGAAGREPCPGHSSAGTLSPPGRP